MIVQRLGRRVVTSVNEDFPLKLGDRLRVTHHTPTTNKFKIGGPNLRG